MTNKMWLKLLYLLMTDQKTSWEKKKLLVNTQIYVLAHPPGKQKVWGSIPGRGDWFLCVLFPII